MGHWEQHSWAIRSLQTTHTWLQFMSPLSLLSATMQVWVVPVSISNLGNKTNINNANTLCNQTQHVHTTHCAACINTVQPTTQLEQSRQRHWPLTHSDCLFIPTAALTWDSIPPTHHPPPSPPATHTLKNKKIICTCFHSTVNHFQDNPVQFVSC